MTEVTERQKRTLRGLGHALRPVVMIADGGLSDTVRQEIENALVHHELIKISIRVGDRDDRDTLLDTLCQDFSATLVQRIGNTALVFRRNPDRPRVVLGSR